MCSGVVPQQPPIRLAPAAAISSAMAAGTRLKLMAIGNTIAFMENGVQRIAVADGAHPGQLVIVTAYACGEGRQRLEEAHHSPGQLSGHRRPGH